MSITTPMTQLLGSLEGDQRQVLGTSVRILARSKDTGGSHSVYICTVPTDQGPPPHRHEDFDESFFVLEGEVEIFAEGQWRSASKGSYVSFPRGSVHTFRNVKPRPAVFLGIANPAGHEAFFDAADQLPNPPTVEEVLAVCAQERIEIVMP